MKKSSLILFAAAGLMTLASCSKDTEIFNAENAKDAAIKENVEKIFGVTFDPNQDWSTTTSGEVTILTDATVKDVLLLAKIQEIYDDNVPSYVTRYTMNQLNEAKPNGRTSITMSYDAPKNNLGLYVCFVTDRGNFYQKVEGNTVSMNSANARVTRADEPNYNNYPLITGTYTIVKDTASYASERGWNTGELLYQLSDADYSNLKMNLNKYTDDAFRTNFSNVIDANFKNGRGFNNLPRVIASKYYNKDGYASTDGKHVVIVSPIYKRDKPTEYGYEVWNSDLYYYYYKATDVANMTDAQAAAYFKSLPKYKAFPFGKAFGRTEDGEVGDHGSFVLLYFGDETPEAGTTKFVATQKKDFVFPEGYNIGFMVRARTDAEAKKVNGVTYYPKQGEVYADGRLNKEINTLGPWHFKSSGLGEDGPRAVWVNIDGKLFLSWESGTDADFNDIIFEVEGVSAPTPGPSFEPNTFTYCFEDTDLGDYDMNDVVVKAVRESETTVKYYIEACGAYDELFLRNFKYDSNKEEYKNLKINETEVHVLLGSEPENFINTQKKDREPLVVTRTVSENFKLEAENNNDLFYIYNKTTNKNIKLAKKGEDPHAIMVACDFAYPREQVCIKDAYEWFNKWGTGDQAIVTTGWFLIPKENLVCSWFVTKE